VATTWVNERSRRFATPCVPVIGPRYLFQLVDYLAALDLSLSDEQCGRFTTVSAVALGVPP
jgi:aryl-alcohol dehydrogenase-like predicted oxidoreductase